MRDLGRQQRIAPGLANLSNKYPPEHIEAACEAVLRCRQPSYKAVKHRVEQLIVQDKPRPAAAPQLQQSGPQIRPIEEYQAFWEYVTTQQPPSCGEKTHADVAR